MSTLAVEGLRVMLPTPAGEVTVVDGVDYDVQPAEVFGIAGESGSGKTVSMLALLGLLPDGSRVEGTALFGGDELIGMPRRRLQSISASHISFDTRAFIAIASSIDKCPSHSFFARPPHSSSSGHPAHTRSSGHFSSTSSRHQ